MDHKKEHKKGSESFFDLQELFSKNLKRLRTEANVSQLTLANQIKLSHNFINDMENGKKWASAKTIAKLAWALQVEPFQFFLSEHHWDKQTAEFLSTYFDVIEDNLFKTTSELRRRYTVDKDEDGAD